MKTGIALVSLASAIGLAICLAPGVARADDASSAKAAGEPEHHSGETAADAPPTGGLGVVRLHIDSPKPVKVIEHIGTSYAQAGRYNIQVEHGEIVCGTPCNKTIDGSNGQEFIVEGDGVPSSETFVLADRQGDTVVHVEPGSAPMLYGGSAMIYVGVLGMVTGISLAVVGATIDSPTSDDLLPVGGILIGGSSALIGGGIALLVLGDTDVIIESKPMQTGAARPASVAPRYWAGEF